MRLASPEAEKQRADYAQMKKWEEQHRELEREDKKKISPSVRERSEKCIETAEKGDLSGWWQLCLELTLSDTSKFYGDELNPDLTALPGWEVCDEGLKKRILTAASEYLTRQSSEPDSWLSTKDTYHRPAMAGFKALVLLYRLERDRIYSLPESIWRNWAPAILAHPITSISSDKSIRDEVLPILVDQAYRNAPADVISSLLVLLDKENDQSGHLFVLDRIRKCLDVRMQAALLNKAKEPAMKADCVNDILSCLLDAQSHEAKKFAESLLTPAAIASSPEKARAAGLALLAKADDAGWASVWEVAETQPEFAKALFLELPAQFRSPSVKSIPTRIGVRNTAQLFVWLSNQFPRETDQIPEGAHFVAPRESIAHFRDRLLSFLQDAGTIDSLEALEYIKRELPGLDFLPLYLLKARENVRRKNWAPLEPNELLTLTKSSLSRLILNSDHLVEALSESLIRLEEMLQGQNPLAFVLWNRFGDSAKMTPKAESDLADFVRYHLDQDLKKNELVALREVEIVRRHGEGGQPGERTDIYVAGLVRATKEQVRVIIEVKGCWNVEVREAMQRQLLDRYLNKPGFDRGIYLVGWFACNQWDKKKDKRRNKTGAESIEDARKYFTAEATKLSSDRKLIRSCVLNCALR
jgi:hypothetical protein